MRGTVGEPRTAASTHSGRVPFAGERVCHQVQLPVQAVALRAAGRRPHWQNQKGKLSSSAVRASASAGVGGCRRRPVRSVWDRLALARVWIDSGVEPGPHQPIGLAAS